MMRRSSKRNRTEDAVRLEDSDGMDNNCDNAIVVDDFEDDAEDGDDDSGEVKTKV